jgi:hypothetical protein
MADFNIAQGQAWLEHFFETRDFMRPGIDQSLGRDVVMEAVA